MSAEAPKTLSPDAVEAIRRSRRTPRLWQYDYLHLRYLRDDLRRVLHDLDPPPQRVLDVFCGTRPYDDLLPVVKEHVAFDVPGNPYGAADVVSDEFLPFADGSFDLVTCIQAFYYLDDPDEGVRELRRVLRPGGVAVVSVPLVWGYERGHLEHRFSEPVLRRLFHGWDTTVIENGGWTASWVAVSTSIARLLQRAAPRRARGLARPLFAVAYAGLNLAGVALGRMERAQRQPAVALPANLLVVATKPLDE